MDKKADCEKAIRYLCGVWAKERGIPMTGEVHAGFSQFKSWLNEKGYSHYLNFRSTTGSDYVAELWFDQEFHLTWRR